MRDLQYHTKSSKWLTMKTTGVEMFMAGGNAEIKKKSEIASNCKSGNTYATNFKVASIYQNGRQFS